MIDDFNLIVASFQSQYGLRLSRELSSMKWSEFKDYLIGIAPETPLGRIVAIRAENNPDILKNFTKEQRHIRNEWRNRKAKAVTQTEMDNYLNMMKNYFIGLSGG